jgi:hypothetical protein
VTSKSALFSGFSTQPTLYYFIGAAYGIFTHVSLLTAFRSFFYFSFRCCS